jgi:hypothetical protein
MKQAKPRPFNPFVGSVSGNVLQTCIVESDSENSLLSEYKAGPAHTLSTYEDLGIRYVVWADFVG